jgi:hypothetical protein
MGSQNREDDDAPLHQVRLDGFWLDATEITNAQFAEFVKATSYVTDAEKVPTEAELPDVPKDQRVAASLVFKKPAGDVNLNEYWRWWQLLPGADWRHPEGPGSDLKGMRSPTRSGPASGCPRKRSGSSRRAVDSTASRTAGATSSDPTASGSRTSGRGRSRARTTAPTGS